MKQKASVSLVIIVAMLAMGIVYFLSNNPRPVDAVSEAASATSAEKSEPSPAATGAGASPQEVAVSPDLRTVNAHQFLDPTPKGRKAPDFTAKTADGKSVQLSDYHGKKNVVMIFYQGSFCSVCGAQLANLQKHIKDFQAQDAEIIAISADDNAHAIKTLGEHGLSFPVIPDADKSIIKKFGVQNISKDGIAWPSAFVIDKQGIVRLSYADESGHRLHSNELLPILSQITGKPAPKLSYGE